jgi:hypothetical protein
MRVKSDIDFMDLQLITNTVNLYISVKYVQYSTVQYSNLRKSASKMSRKTALLIQALIFSDQVSVYQ